MIAGNALDRIEKWMLQNITIIGGRWSFNPAHKNYSCKLYCSANTETAQRVADHQAFIKESIFRRLFRQESRECATKIKKNYLHLVK